MASVIRDTAVEADGTPDASDFEDSTSDHPLQTSSQPQHYPQKDNQPESSSNNKAKSASGVAAAIQALENRVTSTKAQPIYPGAATPASAMSKHKYGSLAASVQKGKLNNPNNPHASNAFQTPTVRQSHPHAAIPSVRHSISTSPSHDNDHGKTFASTTDGASRNHTATTANASDDDEDQVSDSTDPYHSDEADDDEQQNQQPQPRQERVQSLQSLPPNDNESNDNNNDNNDDNNEDIPAYTAPTRGDRVVEPPTSPVLSAGSMHSGATPQMDANLSPYKSMEMTPMSKLIQSPRNHNTQPSRLSPASSRPPPPPVLLNSPSHQERNKDIPTTLHIPTSPTSPESFERVASPLSPYREFGMQQQQNDIFLSSPPQRDASLRVQQSSSSRVVRSYTQRAGSPMISPNRRYGSPPTIEFPFETEGISAVPGSTTTQQLESAQEYPVEAASAMVDEALNQNRQQKQQAADKKKKKDKIPPKTMPPRGARGLFGRSSRSSTPTVTSRGVEPERSGRARSASVNEKERSGSTRRSWLGSFRGKPVKGKPEALVVLSPDAGGHSSVSHQRSNSVSSTASHNSMPAASPLSFTNRRGSNKHIRPVPHTIAASPPKTNNDPAAIDAATTKLVQTLSQNPNTPVTQQTAEEALIEVLSLQSEVKELRNERPPDSKKLAALEVELETAQKTASQLEGLNKSYRKTQKQMLMDLQEAQKELEKYHELSVNGSFSADTQQMAGELAATMAELVALREQHQALLASNNKSSRNVEKTAAPDGMLDINGHHLAGGGDDEAYHQHETQLNLQKDLAHAMATISKLEEENDMFRRQLVKLETMEDRLRQAKIERDEYAAQVSDAELANNAGRGGASLATIERLQAEKKQLLSREHLLKEKIQKLDTKNKNQKSIFQTAVEIKDVEIKITKKERDMLLTRIEEVQCELKAGGQVSSEEVIRLESRLKEALEEQQQSSASIGLFTEQVQQLTMNLDTKKKEAEALEESQTKREAQVAELNLKIEELGNQLKEKEKEMADLGEQQRLETFKSRRTMEDKVGALQEQLNEYESQVSARDERIVQLEEDVRSRQEEVERLRRLSARRSSVGSEDGENRSQRLSELRSRLGNYETVMRSKVESLRHMDSPTATESSALPDETMNSMRNLQPTLVVATPLEHSSNDHNKTEESLRRSESRIAELEKELTDKQKELDELRKFEKPEAPESSDIDSDPDQARVQELELSLKESEEQAAALNDQLDDARARLLEAQSSSTPSSHTKIDEAQAQVEMAALTKKLAEKEKACEDLEKKIDNLQKEKVLVDTARASLEAELDGTRSNCEILEAKLLLASKQLVESEQSKKSTSQSECNDKRVNALEQELEQVSARLAEADTQIEMLEEFIKQDAEMTSAIGGSPGFSSEALADKEKEISRLEAAKGNAEEQLARARKNVEHLELEKTNAQAKLTQLSATMEKQQKGETDAQLYKKCIELAEVTAEKETLSQQLRAANALIKRLETQFDGHQGSPEADNDASGHSRAGLKLVEAELKIDELREKLCAAEKSTKELEKQNERLAKSNKHGANGVAEDVKTRMRFLEEQNAAYAASLKALRIEIATRHEGTAFE